MLIYYVILVEMVMYVILQKDYESYMNEQIVRDNAMSLSLNLQPLDEQIKFARSHRDSGRNVEKLLADVRKIAGISD